MKINHVKIMVPVEGINIELTQEQAKELLDDLHSLIINQRPTKKVRKENGITASNLASHIEYSLGLNEVDEEYFGD